MFVSGMPRVRPGPQHFPAAGLAVLAAWALIGTALARRFFRWHL